jgi:hypothetical protein
VREGDFTAGERLALCWRHANEDAVAPEAVIDLAGDFLRNASEILRDKICSEEVRARLRWPMLLSSSASCTPVVSLNNTMNCLVNCPMKPCAALAEESD